MIDFNVNRKSLDDWQAGISRRFRREAEIAQEEVRRLWMAELINQSDTGGYGEWEELSPSYAKRKQRDYDQGRIAHNTLLRRTGDMIQGYITGITPFITRGIIGVRMPFPEDHTRRRAMVHQGEAFAVGVPARPFNVEIFEEIALDIFNEAMSKAAGNE